MLDHHASQQLQLLVADDDDATLNIYHEVFSQTMAPPELTSDDDDTLETFFQSDQRVSESFELTLCRQGNEAVEAVRQSLQENRYFAIAFLDVRMPPGPDGIQTAEMIRAVDQNIQIVIVTGYDDIPLWDISDRIPPLHKLFYLQKPLDPQEIYQFACSLGAKWRSEQDVQKAHDELSGWLQERTGELMEVNTQLTQEIQERQRIEEALKRSEEQHRIVLETTPDPVIVYNMEGEVTYLNPAFFRVFGWELPDVAGQPVEFVPVEKLYETRVIFEKIKQGEMISGIETSRMTKNGKRIEVSLSGAGFFDRQGALLGSVITLQDITERKKTEEEIRFIAYHDTLTGLPNRKSFYLRLEDELIRSRGKAGGKRRVNAQRWALLFLDVDRFKSINDTLGHDVGDALLKLMATRIWGCLRKSDHIFRLAGDEFTIILTDLTDSSDAAKVCQKIRAEVAQPCTIKGHELYTTVSIGISLYPDDGEDVERLVKNADMAMYAAKEEHRGYRFFTEEMNRKAMQRMMLEGYLRNALPHNEFLIYYQPLVDSQNRIVGSEALLRWRHPELGLLPPIQFIPIAEETGMIIEIGKWVLQTACEQAKQWHQMGYEHLYVAVNLSTRQFKEPDLVEMVEQVLAETGLPAHALKLEVTESGIMEEPELAILKMELLRQKGVLFSIDDFGTGYSSLGYLKRFPIDILKIDRSFVMDSIENTDDQEIIRTIINMARTLHMQTVAEGVETREQQEFLISQGCHIMQGYYHGRPMPANEFENVLHANKSTR